MKRRIYFDNAATTAISPVAAEALAKSIIDLGNPSSLHGFGREVRLHLENAREEIASSLGALASEVIFTGSGTEANNTAIKGLFWHRGGRKVIITTAIERVASDQVAETTVALVPLPNDEMKGRIIGRQGRNIRAIEVATGVDLVVDDTPEAVILSSHNPVRREIARVALNKLISDGRIHPGRIEKIVEKAEEEVNQTILESGEQAALEAGITGLHPEIIKLLGQLKFRTSYGQNVLAHAVETSHLAGMMASELKADVMLAKAGALLHDIGKAVTHEVGGAHALIGADIARKHGVPERVCNIIASHHGEEESTSLEAVLVLAADAISGARPGARRESLEQYLKRVEALETMANAFTGVQQSFAIQAGREIRIIVKPEEIDDLGAINLCKQIARKVEDNLEYPGQIKVTVVRETRSVEYAK